MFLFSFALGGRFGGRPPEEQIMSTVVLSALLVCGAPLAALSIAATIFGISACRLSSLISRQEEQRGELSARH